MSGDKPEKTVRPAPDFTDSSPATYHGISDCLQPNGVCLVKGAPLCDVNPSSRKSPDFWASAFPRGRSSVSGFFRHSSGRCTAWSIFYLHRLNRKLRAT